MAPLVPPQSEQFLDAEHVFAPKLWRRLGRFLPVYAVAWIFVGWCTISIFADSFADGASPLGLLVGTAKPVTDHQKFGWFFVFAQSIAMLQLLDWIWRGLRGAESALEKTQPLPAVNAGAPPRCRSCNAPLATPGAVRRCASCGVDHLLWQPLVSAASKIKPDPKRTVHAALLTAARRLTWWPAMLVTAVLYGVILALVMGAIFHPTPLFYLVPFAWGGFVVTRFLRSWRDLSAIERTVEKKPAARAAILTKVVADPPLTKSNSQPASPTDIAFAKCTSCGGSMPIQLSQTIVCPFCGARDAIGPSLAKLLGPVRERIANRVAEQQQFAGEQQVFTQKSFDYAERYLPLYLVLWLLMTPLYFVVINAMKPSDVSFLHFVLGLTPMTTDDAPYAWSFFFAGACNLVITAALPAFGFAKLRQIVLSARAVAPATPGAPPRCRCCLAELPAEGLTRRCAYCGADHLVVDDQYRQEEASLDAAIAAAMEEGERTLRQSLLRTMSYVSWALGLIIVIYPVTFFSAVLPLALLQIMQPAPWLLLFPLAALVVAIRAYLRAWGRLKAMAVFTPQEV